MLEIEQAEEPKPEPKSKPMIGCIVIVVTLIGLGWMCGTMMEGDGDSEASVSTVEACIISENFMRDQLIAPASADFPWTCVECYEPTPGTFMVQSYVDAQNAYGATIRTNYNCTIRYTGGDWTDRRNWQLESIEAW